MNAVGLAPKLPLLPAPHAQATAQIAPLDVFPMENDSLVEGDGWAGINKPIKVKDGAGDVYVAKSNTLGDFAALYPGHDPRIDDIHEIVTSHIIADEFHLPSLTFQEGTLIKDGKQIPRVLSRLQTDFRTLEDAPITAIKDGDTAVALTILQGCLMGDFDSTLNDSNVWVKNDGKPMGSDYGYAGRRGIRCAGLPYANVKIMHHFATKENVTAITDKIKALTDDGIRSMVERQGSKWIHDWTPAMSREMSDNMIANRDALRKDNPYMRYVEGFHPLIQTPLVKLKYPRFFWCATGAQAPPLRRPDEWLDVLASMGKYLHMKRFETVCRFLRGHVPSPDDAPKPQPAVKN